MKLHPFSRHFTPPLTPPRQGEGNLCAYMGRAVEDATMHAPPGVKKPQGAVAVTSST